MGFSQVGSGYRLGGGRRWSEPLGFPAIGRRLRDRKMVLRTAVEMTA